MIPFAETSFLCSLYRQDVFSEDADRWVREWGQALPVSTLVLFEFKQSIRLHTRLHDSNPQIGLPRGKAMQILRDFDQDKQQGVLGTLPVDWPCVHERAEHLSDKYTWDEGYRFADILHVATALCLSRDVFLTFDNRQAELARCEGLKVPFAV